MRRTLAALVAAALLLVACGDDDADTADDTTTTTEADSASTTVESTTTTTAATGSTTTEPTPTTAAGGLPGERVDIFPYAGAFLAVVGVEADDVLNVRSGPGVEFDVVATLPPLDSSSVATGHVRDIGGAFWTELDTDGIDGVTGWANIAFLAQLGGTTDDTAALYPTPADRPGAETMLDLGLTVAGEYASEDPESVLTVVDGPTVRGEGQVAEIIVDVIGIGDDAARGFRVHVFADEGPDAFSLRSVETTTLCARGVDGDLCV